MSLLPVAPLRYDDAMLHDDRGSRPDMVGPVLCLSQPFTRPPGGRRNPLPITPGGAIVLAPSRTTRADENCCADDEIPECAEDHPALFVAAASSAAFNSTLQPAVRCSGLASSISLWL